MVTLIMFAPGSTSAGDSISLPDWAPPVKEIAACIVVTLSDGTNAGSIASKTVVTDTPSSGQVQLVDEGTIKLGDDTTDRDIVILIVAAKGEYSGA